MKSVDPDELTTAEFKAVVQSRAFQKMLLYHRLSEGIEALEEQDKMFDAMVSAITKQHSNVDSEAVTREFVNHFVREIRTYTEPLDDGVPNCFPLDHSGGEETESNQTTDAMDARDTVQRYLEARLADSDTIELKAKEIAEETGLQSTHVGTILGRWRNSETAPVAVSASETLGSGNIWRIEPLDDTNHSD